MIISSDDLVRRNAAFAATGAFAGLPGAEWWAAASADGTPHDAHVELDAVNALYTENDLWSAVFESNT